MCGIVGYVGARPCRDLLVAGLEKLEYRGYDSAGLSLLAEGRIESVRAVGNLKFLKDAVEEATTAAGGVATVESTATIGIGHTRWATHGRVTEANAHPHSDTTNRVHIVLNGIVENWTDLREHDRLPGNGVAVTVMTNYGFHQAMRGHGVEVATTDVGDRNVLTELIQRGWALGGEQSGHIIDTGFVPAGDGTAAALLVLEALAGGDLAERHAMEKLPQRLLNVRVADPRALDGAEEVWAAVEAASTRLEGRGRVLVRSSGTEPLIRIMVEAPHEEECEEIVQSLAKTVQSCLP